MPSTAMKMLAQVVLGAVETTIGTVPAGRIWRVPLGCLIICNTTVLAATFSLHSRIGGAAAAVGNRIVDTRALAAQQTDFALATSIQLLLDGTDVLSGIASAAATFTVTVYGYEIVVA